MTARPRLLLTVLLPLVALGGLAPSSGAQDPPAPEVGATLQPSVEDAGGRIDSWALAPAGSSDPEAAGNRPDLSYEVDPGATIEDAVTVYNFGNVQLTFGVYATDARNTASGQFDSLPADEPPTDVGSWIDVGQANVTVPPGQQVTLPITIEVPADASPGDHVGTILASNAAAGVGPDGKTVVLDRRAGTRVYVRVAGPLEPELAIESVKTSYHPTLNPLDGSATVQYRIRNRGNVRLGGAHSLSISGPFGVARTRIAAQDLPELLPGEDAVLEAELDHIPATGLLVTEVRLEPVGDGGDLAVDTQRAFALAPPITVILLLLAIWLAVRSRRAYRRHRAEDRRPPPAEPPAGTKEPQLT